MKEQAAKKSGRPVTREMPEPIPDTPENSAEAVRTSPVKPEGSWDYLKKNKWRRKVTARRAIPVLAAVLVFGTVTAEAQICRGRKTGDRLTVECRESYTAMKNRIKRERADRWAKRLEDQRERFKRQREERRLRYERETRQQREAERLEQRRDAERQQEMRRQDEERRWAIRERDAERRQEEKRLLPIRERNRQLRLVAETRKRWRDSRDALLAAALDDRPIPTLEEVLGFDPDELIRKRLPTSPAALSATKPRPLPGQEEVCAEHKGDPLEYLFCAPPPPG